MKYVSFILILCGMAFSHASYCQQVDTTGRMVIHVKKKHQPRKKFIYANVAGIINGTISKDSLINIGRVKLDDRQKRHKNLLIVCFEMLHQKKTATGTWYTTSKVKTFSYFHGGEFSDEMKNMIKHCDSGDRIVLYVNYIYKGAEGVGFDATVNLCLR